MKVVLSTIGKFWTFDLARQLQKRGALGMVFSGYPWFKLRHEGLPRETVKTFPWLHAPFMRFAPSNDIVRRSWEWQDKLFFDRHVAAHLPPSDVFCGISGSGLASGRAAKRRGMKYVCDRGSAHIRFQARVLAEEHDRQGIAFSGVDPRVIDREESEYEMADRITVPSTFALESFVENGVPREKLKLAPYGVELSLFYPDGEPSGNEFQVLFVGTVSVRKGIHYLVDGFDKLERQRKRLILVGPIEPSFRETIDRLRLRADIDVMGPKPYRELKSIMSKSHVMVLPSVEDGFGLVMAQAMACGCPVIASANTGGADLFTDNVEGFTIPIRDSDSLAARLQLLADRPDTRSRMGATAMERVKGLGGWDNYGDIIYRAYSEMFA
jgi:starch synthase